MNTSQLIPVRIAPLSSFHFSFRLASHYIDLDRDHPWLSYEPSIAVEFLKSHSLLQGRASGRS